MSLAAFRPLRPRNPAEHHRTATTLELFFDLLTVIALAAVTAGLHHAISAGHGAEALPRFAFLFMAIWWAWMNYTWFASAFDNDDVPYRLLVMVIMLGALIFAGGAGAIFEGLDFGFGILGWVIMRAAMVVLWLRAAAGSPDHRQTCRRYAAGIVLAQAAWLGLYFAIPPGTPLFYLLGIAIYGLELAVPVFAESARPTPFHRHHIIERYGLLMIISMGEIMLSISHGFGTLFGEAAAGGASLAPVVTSVSALVIVFAAWWVYFCEEEHLASAALPGALVWGYGHVAVFLSIALLGAAVAAEVDAITHHGTATPAEAGRWLGAGMALYALSLWAVRDALHRMPPHRQAALPAIAVLSMFAGALGAASWIFAAIAVLMVAWRAPWARSAPV